MTKLPRAKCNTNMKKHAVEIAKSGVEVIYGKCVKLNRAR